MALALAIVSAPLAVLDAQNVPSSDSGSGLAGGAGPAAADSAGAQLSDNFAQPSLVSGGDRGDPGANSSNGISQAAGATGALQEQNPPGSDAAPGFGASTAAQLGNSVMNPAAIARRLGLSTAELAGLRNEAASGMTPDQVQQLCLRFAARQMTPADVGAIAKSLGLALTGQQLAQLKSCTQLGAPTSPLENASAPQNLQPGQHTTAPRGSSLIEKSFHALDSDTPPAPPSARNLSQFGYSLFDSRVSTFAPVSNVPVGNDYVLGPGDELKMLIWGRVNDRLDLTVQRDGSVLLPQMGPLQVAGLTFAQGKQLIEQRGEQITGVKVDVTMGRLRTIQVFVIGEVREPGAYTVSALSHITNALAASGGITRVGSLRRIELRRQNRVIKSLDLYAMLLNGDTSADVQLAAGDVIFVPVIGPVAAVAGDVKRPAIYELGGSAQSLQDALRLAGGISAFGYSQRVQVERVENHLRRVALDVDLNELRAHRFEVADGDLIKVYPVLPQQRDIVTVAGNVNRPGSYQWYSGMRVADLVRAAEGVAPHTFFRYALIRRQSGPEKSMHLVPVDLGEALADELAGQADAALDPQDTLTVFNEMQIKDLPTVQVFGEVRNPGFYVLDHGMRVSDLVFLAGGLKDDAYMGKAELARTQVINGVSTRHTYEDVDLRETLGGSGMGNPLLMTNDQLFVRKASDWHLPWVVEVKGQVLRPGPYTIHEGERLASVLERCGGLMNGAYPQGAVFIRQSIKQLEQKRLDQARQQLQQAVARAELRPASLDEDKSNTDPKALEMLQRTLAQTENQQAQGRLVIHLRPFDQLAASPDNVVLEDQDEIMIPRRPAGVNVLGQVYSPNAIVYQPELTVRDYLERAGGPNEGADTDHIFVVKADGSILTEEGLKSGSRGTMFPLLPVISGGLMGQRLEPGDTVFVPEKLIYKNNLKLYSNVAQIFASTAQTLAIFALAAGL
ncbi:MAG TPA: SLBB domain-containing protein [Candidatus Binataceae bacterium]|nr:SLBB domain-containing protein [Candidatus Binataceae bacterium]